MRNDGCIHVQLGARLCANTADAPQQLHHLRLWTVSLNAQNLHLQSKDPFDATELICLFLGLDGLFPFGRSAWQRSVMSDARCDPCRREAELMNFPMRAPL